MNNVIKGMILAFMIVYLVSPVDGCPGPVDDIIVLLLGWAARKGLSESEE